MFRVCRIALRVGLIGTIMVTFTGCGIHMYDQPSHNAAKDVRSAITAADYRTVIATERENLDALLTAELNLVSQLTDAERRVTLAQLTTSGERVATEAEFSAALANEVKMRLPSLGATQEMSDEDLARLATIDVRIEGYEARLSDTIEFFYLSFAFQPPPCTPDSAAVDFAQYLASLGERKRKRIEEKVEFGKEAYDQFLKDCNKVLEDGEADFDDLGDGLIQAARQELMEAKLTLIGLEANARDAEKRFAEAEKALKEATKTEPTLTEQLSGKLAAVKSALETLSDGANFAGLELGSDKMIAEIDAILEAIVIDPEGSSPDGAQAGAKPSMAMLAALPAFADRAENIGRLLTSPPVSALIIEKQRLKVLKQQALRQRERLKQRIDLLRVRLFATVGEFRSLLRARNALQRGGKRNLYLATAYYLSTYSLHRNAQEQVDYRLISLDHQIAVDRAEDSLGLWYALIEQPAEQLVAYFDTGIRREEIIALLQAFGVVGTAVGVNR